MPPNHDIFLSYRRHDLDRIRPLLDALDAAGLRVWRDETNLPDNAPITPEIRHAIANSKTLLALYSATYPESNPCRQEITAAWIAAQQQNEPPHTRVLILNPEPDFDHIPAVLAEQQSIPWPADPSGFPDVAARIKDLTAPLATPLAAASSPATPRFHGIAATEAPRFVGRVQQMWQLHGQLTANRMSIITGVTGQTTSQVRGLGGNGKSLLAREYAVRFAAAYAGGVFWLNAFGNDDTKGPLDPQARESLRQDQLRAFAIDLEIPIDGLSPAEVEAALWSRLAANDAPLLWIVDDLPSGLDAPAIERQWTARWPGAATLVTTRSQEYGALGRHLDLEVLSHAEAWDLLTSHRQPPNDAEAAAARDVIAELGRHPLAIEIAGSYLARGLQTFTEYLDDLRHAPADAVEYGADLRETLPTGHERSIARTLNKSIRLLGEEGLDLLRLASLLAVAPIPVRLVEAVFDRLDEDGSAKRRTLQALDQADSLSLCAKASDDARTVHTLVSRTIRYQPGHQERIETFRTVAQRTLSELLKVVTDIRRHSEVDREIAHARHVLSDGITSEEAAILGGLVGRHDFEQGDYDGARQLQEQVLGSTQRLLGDTHPGSLVAMNNLAETSRAQGDLSVALQLQQRLLDSIPGSPKVDPLFTLTATNNLAQILKEQGELSQARQVQEEVLTDSLRMLGTEDIQTLTAKNNLAEILRAEGDLPGVLRLQKEVCESSERLLGVDHSHTLSAMSNMANTIQELGDLSRALQIQEHVLEIRARLLGDRHPETLTAMNNLAKTLQAQGDLDGARSLYRKVLDSLLSIHPSDHPNTLKASHNLAQTLQAQGDLAGARRLLEQVLESSRRLLGEQHPDSLRVMDTLGQVIAAQGDLSGAHEVQQSALDATRRLLGANHPDTLVAKHNLALTLYRRGDLSGARRLQEEVLKSRLQALGTEHISVLATKSGLALTLQSQGNLSEARGLQEEVLASSQHLLGVEHPDTLGAKNNLAQTMKALGDLSGARQLEEQVLGSSQRSLGTEHPGTLAAMGNLAQTLNVQGDLPGARQLGEQVLESRQRLLGAEHPDTLTAMANLAWTMHVQGDLPRARQLQAQVLEISQRLLGAEHPDTLTARSNLAQTLYAQGDLPGARQLQDQVLESFQRVLGAQHPDTLTARHNLAQTVKAQGDLPGTRQLFEQVLESFQRVLGAEHPDTLTAMANLAVTLRAQGDLPGARQLQEQVLESRQRLLGPEHPDTTIAAWNLFWTFHDTGDTDAAGRTLTEHLFWLLQRAPSTLASSQQQIRAMLLKIVGEAGRE